jgi:hypothetical protein
MPKTRPQYPEQFGREAVQLVRSGRSIGDVAESLGCRNRRCATGPSRSRSIAENVMPARYGTSRATLTRAGAREVPLAVCPCLVDVRRNTDSMGAWMVARAAIGAVVAPAGPRG